MKVILIGFGLIAPKYTEVLEELGCNISGIITRNYEKTLNKAKEFGIKKVYRSFDEISENDCDFFITLTSPENNESTIKKIIKFGKPILAEKPVAFGSSKMDEIINLKNQYKTKIMVAMNRRFYSNFHYGLKYLEEKDKKLESIVIEAPERFSDINSPIFTDIVRKNWIYCNPIHCIDLIRFFGGNITKIDTNVVKEQFIYTAIGKCSKDVGFTYISNWKTPGSWSVTLYADDVRITYNPLEKGIILKDGNTEAITLSEYDKKFKPGFYHQIKYFIDNCVLSNEKSNWPESDLEDHKKTLELIEKIHQTN